MNTIVLLLFQYIFLVYSLDFVSGSEQKQQLQIKPRAAAPKFQAKAVFEDKFINVNSDDYKVIPGSYILVYNSISKSQNIVIYLKYYWITNCCFNCVVCYVTTLELSLTNKYQLI